MPPGRMEYPENRYPVQTMFEWNINNLEEYRRRIRAYIRENYQESTFRTYTRELEENYDSDLIEELEEEIYNLYFGFNQNYRLSRDDDVFSFESDVIEPSIYRVRDIINE